MTIRDKIIAEAKSWLNTPWHHNAMVKGHGVDCAQFLIAVYSKLGLIPAINTGFYSQEWHLRRDESKFVAWVEQFADKVAVGLPGDIAMFQFGRHPAHGAIVLDWPNIIHAYIDTKCVAITNTQSHSNLHKRFYAFYRLKVLA